MDEPVLKRPKVEEQRGESAGQDDFQLRDFKKFFFKLNTLYTFLSCRKHVVPSFETLSKPLNASMKREVNEMDFARVVALMPRGTVFKYIDENQIVTERKLFDFNKGGYQQRDNDIFELEEIEKQFEESRSTQILIFEFVDGTMKRTWNRNGQDNPNKQVFLPTYTPEEMKKMIKKREAFFNERLSLFIEEASNEGIPTMKKLDELALKHMPKPKDYEDPITSMLKAKEEKEKQVVNEETGESRPLMTEMVSKLKKSEHYNGQIKTHMEIPQRHAEYGELNVDIDSEILDAIGYSQFYSHQADAINAVHNGENVIITTSTSSGKSLIYQLSAFDLMFRNPESTFMYIFPTKALAQDQKRAFQVILSKIPSLKNVVVDTYDGDTDPEKRSFIRNNARVIFTNPDMIHASILPNHVNWRRFLFNLHLVVIDELHIYKGLFGSHVALVMRRLLRLCREHYDNFFTRFISCSATLKNPVKHMMDIFGIDKVRLISNDGSPRGTKHLVVWNPPVLSQHDRKRENFISESAKILVDLILANVRTIAFCYVRRVCELLMKEVRSIFEEIRRQDLITDVMSYRGGYSAADRRKIEREMFHGNLKAVISTNALELGIDIGGLDAVLMCGFPLSLANFHQQSGRAGRRSKDSLTVVVASDSPVDQHYVAHPDLLMNSEDPDSFQDLVLDFTNMLIVEGHVQCASFELPVNIERDKKYFNDKLLRTICHERLQKDENGYHCNIRFLPWPSKHVNLRGAEEDQFAVVDITNGRNKVIEEVEASRTSFTLYDGGIFIHQGYPYLVKEFNPEEKYATVQRVDVDWVTNQRDFTDIDPQEIEYVRSMEGTDVPVYFGKIKVTIIVFGFFKLDKFKRIIDAVEVHNPPVIINSKGLWIDIPSRALEILESKQLNAAGAIHAAQHAIMGLLPKFIVAGSNEIQTECKAPEKEFAERQTKRKRPARLVFFDSHGGSYGSGLSSKAFEHIQEILNGTLQRITDCPCEDGCPECVAASYCKENSLVLSKPGSLVILHCILGHEEDDYIDLIKDGPEPNMPEIKVETVIPVKEHVNFAPDFEILDIKNIKKEEGYIINEDENNKLYIKKEEETINH